ncbi:hypothetical protein Tco_0200845 [Tanacetum coccineum]
MRRVRGLGREERTVVIQKEFPEDVQVMMNVFESMKSELDETLKQNVLLKDRLLEGTLIHDVEKYVLMHYKTKNDDLNVEIFVPSCYCDLDFEPLSLSLTLWHLAILRTVDNILIMVLILNSFKSELGEVFVFKSRSFHEDCSWRMSMNMW